MGKINVLSFAVANLIAAGEVVDRPASVIKELMENAIDAGATRIAVEIQNGGVTFMRVADNGCGMSREDLPVCVRRHATSKIHDASDLDGIITLGFRGEALAAIASVSHLRIISKCADEPVGAMLEATGGEDVQITERGCPVGTTVIVEDLFANVPARRKFLKKDVTEAMAVAANVERVALSRPDIAFTLIIDGAIKLETAGDGNLKSAIYAVYGRDFANRMIEVGSENDGIGVSGFIGRSDNVRGNRNCQDFFINGRYVKSKTAMAALEQAYVSYMPPEKYPCCVLNLTIHPARVDVNVHPAKLEVHFSNEKPVFEAIYYTVRQALEQNVTRPDLRLDQLGAKTSVPAATPAAGSKDRMPDRISAAEWRAQGEKENAAKDRHGASGAPSAPTSASSRRPQNGWGGSAVNAFEPVREHGRAESLGRRQLTVDQIPTSGLAPSSASVPASAPDQVPPVTPSAPAAAGASSAPDDSFAGFAGLSEPISAEAYARACLEAAGAEKPGPEAPGLEAPGTGVPQTGAPSPQNETEKDVLYAHVAGTDAICGVPAPGVPAPGTSAPGDSASDHAQAVGAPAGPESSPVLPSWRIVGEAFNAYVLVERGDVLLLIDQHAAHERILFEQLKAAMLAEEPVSQLLMLPVEVMLTSAEVDALASYTAELQKIGFSFTAARYTIHVEAIPVGIEPADVSAMLMAMADQILHGTGEVRLTRDIIFEKALYQASCKAAIKAGREYAPGHLEWVVRKLMEIPDITFCPHGRPVAIELSKKALDKQFERL